MPVFGRTFWFALAGVALVATGVAIPASGSRDALFAATIPATSALISPSQARSAMLAAGGTLPYQIDIDGDDAAQAAPDADDSYDSAAIDPDLECMAKVVRHEAANQPRAGQLAVAQLIMNRLRSGRFPSTVCGVVNQPGQFFQTASYHPSTKDHAWRLAVEVSREARDGDAEDVAGGAIFYHAAYQPSSAFLRGHVRVMQLGDHIFYR